VVYLRRFFCRRVRGPSSFHPIVSGSVCYDSRKQIIRYKRTWIEPTEPYNFFLDSSAQTLKTMQTLQCTTALLAENWWSSLLRKKLVISFICQCIYSALKYRINPLSELLEKCVE
jgi:hypothetical protein